MGYFSDASLLDYESSDAATCTKHLLDQSLKERLDGNFSEDECSFCEVAGPGVAVAVDELLALGIEKVQLEFSPAANYGAGLEALGISYESEYDTGDALFYVYEGAVDDDLLEAIRACGNDQTWVPENLLYLDEQQRMAATWEEFVATVKHRRRFWFSEVGDQVSGADPEKLGVADFFASIAELLTRPRVVAKLPAGSILLRGRMVHSEKAVAEFDGKELGSPPVAYAAANRMSPAGVSMYYGGDSPEVVVAEIGAHSTYDHAIYGTFNTLRDLVVIDFTALPPVPGYTTR